MRRRRRPRCGIAIRVTLRNRGASYASTCTESAGASSSENARKRPRGVHAGFVRACSEKGCRRHRYFIAGSRVGHNPDIEEWRFGGDQVGRCGLSEALWIAGMRDALLNSSTLQAGSTPSQILAR